MLGWLGPVLRALDNLTFHFLVGKIEKEGVWDAEIAECRFLKVAYRHASTPAAAQSACTWICKGFTETLHRDVFGKEITVVPNLETCECLMVPHALEW